MPRSVFTPAYKQMLETLIAARKEAGVKQSDLAKALNWHQSYVSHVESGIRRLDVIEFCGIAKVLGYDPVDLFKRVAAALPDDLGL